MLFSIIIPVYNAEKYIHECLESILAQNFKDFEVILVDDGSPDNCGDICDEYMKKDDRVKVIHKTNQGASSARNEGLKLSVGQYVIFIDSDDYIKSEDFLAKVYEQSKKNPDVILYKFEKYFDEEDRFSDCSFSLKNEEKLNEPYKIINMLVSNDAFYCAAWTKCVKASLLKEHNIEFEVGTIAEDQQWYYRVLEHTNRFAMIDESFIVYRQRNGSVTTSNKTKDIKDATHILENCIEMVKRSNLHKDMKDALYNSMAKLYCNLLVVFSRVTDIEKKQYIKRIKRLSYLLGYKINSRVKIFYFIYNLLGFKGTITAIGLIDRIKSVGR
ncbi:glycosyltransferase family 2 protein [Neobacillus sp. SAB-20_R2A]|uniref:glycosyltransferase family 2 protein n=1 Tax=Neobacillus sp. SAB-20_R2A TaxID=3120519 RepID=UPI003C6E3BF1